MSACSGSNPPGAPRDMVAEYDGTRSDGFCFPLVEQITKLEKRKRVVVEGIGRASGLRKIVGRPPAPRCTSDYHNVILLSACDVVLVGL